MPETCKKKSCKIVILFFFTPIHFLPEISVFFLFFSEKKKNIFKRILCAYFVIQICFSDHRHHRRQRRQKEQKQRQKQKRQIYGSNKKKKSRHVKEGKGTGRCRRKRQNAFFLSPHLPASPSHQSFSPLSIYRFVMQICFCFWPIDFPTEQQKHN